MLLCMHMCTGIGEPSQSLFVKSLLVDKERMKPGHWLGLVRYVLFSTLTLMVELDIKDVRSIKNAFH